MPARAGIEGPDVRIRPPKSVHNRWIRYRWNTIIRQSTFYSSHSVKPILTITYTTISLRAVPGPEGRVVG